MDVNNGEHKVASNEATIEEQTIEIPLLEDFAAGNQEEKPPKNPATKAIRETFKGTAHLANLLPTGSVLTFQILSPVFTHEGECISPVCQTLTLGFVIFCAISCFVLCFTDSFRDAQGKVRHGLATFRGIWVIDGPTASLPAEEAAKFRMRFIDLVHAILSVLVFGAVAMFDKNVVHCLLPTPSPGVQEMLTTLPTAVGVISSVLFLAFPSNRHGIGFPLSRR